jgi:hypothetical protein
MANDKPTETPDPLVFYGWRLSRLFKCPEHVPYVLRRFGPLPQSVLREVIEALDTMVIDWGAAHRKKPPFKFVNADPRLKRLQNFLRKAQIEWSGLRPEHQTFFSLAVEMVPQNERKEKAELAAAAIDLGMLATRLLPIIEKMRDPKEFNAAHRLPHHKSAERAFLWEPVLRLMQKYQVTPGQRGSTSGAIKSLHHALGIDPQEGAVRKMLHDLRQAARRKD